MLLTLIYVLKDEIRKKKFITSKVYKLLVKDESKRGFTRAKRLLDDYEWKDVKEILKAIIRKMNKTPPKVQVPGFEKMVVEARELYKFDKDH